MRLLRLVALLLILVIIVGVWWIAHDTFPITRQTSTQPFAAEYRITGTARFVNVTYINATGGTEQQKLMPLPFSYAFAAVEGQFLYISAQNNGDSGSVTCHIFLDGSEQKVATSDGGFTIADCSGRFVH